MLAIKRILGKIIKFITYISSIGIVFIMSHLSKTRFFESFTGIETYIFYSALIFPCYIATRKVEKTKYEIIFTF